MVYQGDGKVCIPACISMYAKLLQFLIHRHTSERTHSPQIFRRPGPSSRGLRDMQEADQLGATLIWGRYSSR